MKQDKTRVWQNAQHATHTYAHSIQHTAHIHMYRHTHIQLTHIGWNLVSGILMAAYVSGPKWIDLTHSTRTYTHTHSLVYVPSHRTHSHTHTHSLPSFFVALPLLSLPLLFCRPPSLTLSPSHLNFVFLPLTLYLPTFLALSFFLLSSKLQQPLWQRRKRTSRGLVSVWKYLKHNYSSTI